MVEILEKNCNQALDNILKNLSTSDAVKIEQKLWQNIIKIYKENSDSLLINYLIGFYITLHELLFFNVSSKDPFLKYNRCGFLKYNSCDQELLYNIHIRIGDLYRYADCRENAKKYYRKALKIDSKRGSAYNQLALCTPLTKAYQCLYFTIRACYAMIDPIKQADSNIKVSISRLDCPIFENFRITQNIQLNDESSIKIPYPENGQDWFYLIVICIHFNDLNVSLSLLLDRILSIIDYDLKSINFDYLLMALDVALDWILKDRDNFGNNLASIENLKLLNSKFQLTQINDNEETFKMEEDQTMTIGLMHNSILKDFQPLKNIYDKMEYFFETELYQIDKHRKILMLRLIKKLQNF